MPHVKAQEIGQPVPSHTPGLRTASQGAGSAVRLLAPALGGPGEQG